MGELRECLVATIFWMAAVVAAAGALWCAHALLANDARAVVACGRRWVLAVLLCAMSFCGVRSFSKGTNGTDNASCPTNGVDGSSFPTNGAPPLVGSWLRLGTDAPEPDDEPGDEPRIGAISVTSAGVDLVLHRPTSLAAEAVTVTLAGSTNLVAATWESYFDVTFPAGVTDVPVAVSSAQLAAHAVSGVCFFAFIKAGDSDEDGIPDLHERFNLRTDPDAADSDGDGVDDGTEVAQGSDPNDPRDMGLPPLVEECRVLDFHIAGDYAAWEMTVEGLGPYDFRTMHISMVAPSSSGESEMKCLRRGNSYRLTMRWLNNDGHDYDVRAPWYCWLAQIDNLPAAQTFDDYSDARRLGVAEVVIGDGWIAENASGLLTSHVHECTRKLDGSFGGGNVARDKEVLLHVIDVVVDEIRFNRDRTTCTTDGINLIKRYGPGLEIGVNGGEWSHGGLVNDPVCYVAGITPVVDVKFRVYPEIISGVRIGATAADPQGALGDLAQQTCSVSAGDSQLEPTAANFRTRLIEKAQDVMTLLCVPESSSWQNCTSWSFPTSIVVAGESYRVEGDAVRREFSVYSLVGTGVVARGEVAHWTTVMDARIGGFGKTVSSCSTLFTDVVKNIDMVVIGPQTNMIYLSSRLHGVEGTLMCRNLNLDIRGPTNHLDFAVSLMNAGLTETEREPIQPRTVRRWEPTAEELSQWFWGRPQ